MNANKRKKDAEIVRESDRYIDRLYNGCYEEYEDAADYVNVLRGWPIVLKGRVIA